MIVQRGQALGVGPRSRAAAPVRQKKPIAMSALCVATRSRAPRFGCTAISQASFFAQALHEVFINRLLLGGEVHEISCGQRKSPRAIAAGLNKEPMPFWGMPGEAIVGGRRCPRLGKKLDSEANRIHSVVEMPRLRRASPSGVTTFATSTLPR